MAQTHTNVITAMREQRLFLPVESITEPTLECPAAGYLASLVGGAARTTRHASEVYFDSPDPEATALAVREIRKDISAAVASALDVVETFEVEQPQPLAEAKRAYWERAARVGTEHGPREGYGLEDYLRIESGRGYGDIKARVEEHCTEDSVPRSVLGAIDTYHQALGINPAHATTITMELIGRNMAALGRRSDHYSAMGYDQTEATRRAFADFLLDEVPQHVAYVAGRYGHGDDVLRSVMHKGSFYPADAASEGADTRLVLAEADARGLIEVYDIQSRPYGQAELLLGNEIASTPEMQLAMIQVHEGLIEIARQYLEVHKDRARGSLKNFSEIFVPEYTEDGIELLPNPKLIRAMVNNFMPAIALNMLRRGATDITAIEPRDIDAGIHIAAKEFRLFQSVIGQFVNPDRVRGTVELASTFQVVCPANSLFPSCMTGKLADAYAMAQAQLATC